MASEKEEIKKRLVKEYEKRLEETLNEGYGKTLWDMEDEVDEIEKDMSKALMEAKLSLKKNEKPAGM